MATAIVLVGCYYGYNASGGPVGVGKATAKSMVLNIVLVHIIGMLGHAGVLGLESACSDRRLVVSGEELIGEVDLVAGDDPAGGEGMAQGKNPAGDGTRADGENPVDGEDSAGGKNVAGQVAAPTEPIEVKRDAIEFIDVHKAFGRNQVLRGLNMSLPDNQISMILGPSGTGKSVCIKHIVGLLYPDEGDVLVQGVSVPSLPDAELFEMRKKFGVLFQDGALFGSLNLYDNVAFPLRQHTEKGDEEIAEIVNGRLREVGLGGEGEKMPNELSGGMRKRAGFARALVLEPDIVLFDEPDSGLDPVRTALLCELIKEIHAETRRVLRRDHARHHERAARGRAHLGAVERRDRRVRPGGRAVRLRKPVRAAVPVRRFGRSARDGVSECAPAQRVAAMGRPASLDP